MKSVGFPLVVLVSTFSLAACSEVPPAFDGGVGSGTGGDDGGGGCDPPVQPDWGDSCQPFLGDCPENTSCQTVEDLGNAMGICATECCGPQDHERCPDIAPGLEKCVIEDTYNGRWYCAVVCHDSDDCPYGQTCQLANEIDRICYPQQPE